VRTRQNGDGLTVVVATEAPPIEGDSLYATMCIIGRYRGAMGMGDVLQHFYAYSSVGSTYAYVWGLKGIVPVRGSIPSVSDRHMRIYRG